MDPALDRLLRQAAADPDNAGPRWDVAAWLDRWGDPRGELLRADLTLADLAEDDPAWPAAAARRRALSAHADLWRPDLPTIPGVAFPPGDACLVRGLPGRVASTWPALLAGGDRLFDAWPVAALVVESDGDPAAADGAFASRWFGKVRELAVSCGRAGANPMAARLADAPAAAGLRDLSFRAWTGLDFTQGVPALAASPHLGRLERLELTGHDVGDEEATLIAESRTLTGLRAYRSRGVQMSAASVVDDRGAAAFARSPALRLRELRLPSHSVGPAGAAAIAAAGPALAGLAVLDLSDNALGPAGVRALAASPVLGGLRVAVLGGTRPRADGLAAVAASRAFSRCRVLDLTGEDVDDDAALLLAASPFLAADCELRLGRYPGLGPRMTPAGVALLRERFPHADIADV